MAPRTLVACLGNIFLGDDGFGVAVAERLASHDLGGDVQVTDYGIRGMHLAYDLAYGWDRVILVDATARGGAPGTVYVIEPETQPASVGPDGTNGGAGASGAAGGAAASATLLDAHGMQPELMLEMAGVLGGNGARMLIVGCEPASLEEGIGLSAPVAAAVDEAVAVVRRLAEGEHPSGTGTRASARGPMARG
jgi:hydrogenase maturation protease